MRYIPRIYCFENVVRAILRETGIPYQSLINLYLRDCAVNQRKLHMKWHPENAEHGASD